MNLLISLVLLVLMLALIGFVIHLIVTHVPMVTPFKDLIVVAVVVVVVIYLLGVLAGHASLPAYPFPAR